MEVDGDDDAFTQTTQTFLDWFSALPGATFHNDIRIQDLRHRGAGRGIGISLLYFLLKVLDRTDT